MLQLHDRTRRRICLAAFFVLCLAPTALVAAWCVAWQLPGHLSAEIERLRRETGLEIAIDDMTCPRPGTMLYRGLTVADPETGQTVLRCPLLKAVWTQTADSKGADKPAILLTATRPQVETASAYRLVQLLERIVQNQGGWADGEFRLSAKEVVLRTGDGSPDLICLQAGVEAPCGGGQACIVFHVADSAASGPVKVRLVRDRKATPPASRWEFDTGGASLPYSVMGVALPQLTRLGPESRFCGRLAARQTPEGWSIQGDGQAAARIARRATQSDPPPALPQAHLRLGKTLEP